MNYAMSGTDAAYAGSAEFGGRQKTHPFVECPTNPGQSPRILRVGHSQAGTSTGAYGAMRCTCVSTAHAALCYAYVSICTHNTTPPPPFPKKKPFPNKKKTLVLNDSKRPLLFVPDDRGTAGPSGAAKRGFAGPRVEAGGECGGGSLHCRERGPGTICFCTVIAYVAMRDAGGSGWGVPFAMGIEGQGQVRTALAYVAMRCAVEA
eukprot:3933314-Rhodomonas_salina.1